MSLAAGKWIRLRPFADSSGQFRMVVINQCQSIQNNSNYCLESDESTWNDLTGIKLMLRDSRVDESRVLLICLFFVSPASHFTLFTNQLYIVYSILFLIVFLFGTINLCLYCAI